MKICFIGRYNPSENLTGPEKVARRIADEMVVLGHDVSFYEYFFSGKQYGIWTKLFGMSKIENPAGVDLIRAGIVPFIVSLLRRYCDIIHIITFERFALVAILLKVFKKVPIVFSVHGVVVFERPKIGTEKKKALRIKDYICEYMFFRYSDLLFFLSKQSILIASRYYSFILDNTSIIANGVDDIFHIVAANEKNNNKDVRIVFIGDPLRIEKGFAFFLRSLEKCLHRGVVYVICESVPTVDIQNVNGFNIYFIEKMEINAYASFLSDKDIYVSCSFHETFSIAAVEAMSAGLAPIVTEETGMSRYIAPGDNGYLVAYGDENGLARTLDLLISQEPLRRAISQKAMGISEDLVWDKIAKEYIQLYCKRVNTLQ